MNPDILKTRFVSYGDLGFQNKYINMSIFRIYFRNGKQNILF